ncbi:MAG: hypothetical protein M3Q23_12595 [Actinomycetota bacterium]|nr:hypothetical protein [Actinomycetota bacterium]
MAVAVTFVAGGMTREHYDQASRELNREPHPGLILHTVGVTGEGIRVFDIWNSAEEFQAFAQGMLGPGLAAMGITDQPEVTVYDLYNVWFPAPAELSAMAGPGSPADR